MAPRIRPATTLAVVLAIAFAFQLIAILSVPVTKSITLCTYDGYKFGVFGLCHGDQCSGVGIGYNSKELDDVDGFSLPSNARHSVSKLLIVHPISAGFSLILFLSSILLHWHGPSTSLRLLFFLLLWTIPSFLISLLSFLVDILLFVPHLDWGGWIVLAATVLIAVSGVLLCIMRRTVSSRRALQRKDTFGNDYQLQPLNYGYGTVDGNSDIKNDFKEENEDEDERAPFVHDEPNDTFDNTINYTRTNENLNNYPSTQLYDSMRGDNNRSAQSNSAGYRSPENILAPLSAAYRGGLNQDNANNLNEYDAPPLHSMSERDSHSAPYPSDIPNANLEDPPSNNHWRAPYPETDLNLTSPQQQQQPKRYSYNSTPHIASKPSGPRPMPGSVIRDDDELPLLPSEIAAANASNNIDPYNDIPNEPRYDRESNDSHVAPSLPVQNRSSAQDLDVTSDNYDYSLPAYPHDENPHPLVQETKRLYQDDDSQAAGSEPTVAREDTYRTKIANTIDQLQGPEMPESVYANASNPSFVGTNEDLLASHSTLNISRIPQQVDEGNDIDNDDDLYAPSSVNREDVENFEDASEQLTQASDIPADDASSSYSSHIPSTVNSPTDGTVSRGHSLLTPNRGLPSNNPTTSTMAIDNIYDRYARDPTPTLRTPHEGSEDHLSAEDYPFPDPNEKRVTPAPSFSNISLVSSTFTSVSQRGINPKYLENNPEEKNLYLLQEQENQKQQQQQQQQQQPGIQTRPRPMQSKQNTTDILIASNPDFSIVPPTKSKKNKRKPGRM